VTRDSSNNLFLKVGAVEDDKNRKEIAPLLRFFSSTSGDEYTTLDKYVEEMKEGQKSIYYVTGDGREQASMSPVIEKLRSRGYEVLLATEPLDEIMMESLRNYKDFDIVDAAKENLRLDADEDEETRKKKEVLRDEYKEVANYLETLLSSKIQKVVVTDLLTDSPAALVQGAYGMSPTMQRYMKAQAVASGQDSSFPDMNKAVLEINPNHAIVKDLERLCKVDKNSNELKDAALLMYDVAAMTSGYDVPDIQQFAKRVMQLMDEKVQSVAGGVKEAEIVSDELEVESKVVTVELDDESNILQ
jgi:HSP90 family molecular chaperone